MRKMFALFFAMATIFGQPTLAESAAAGLHVEKMMVGTAIDDHDLKGAADTFDANIPRLYCWTKVTAATTPTTVKHIWYADGKQVAEVALPIKYPSTRTWSSKTPSAGAWKVEAVDESGVLLSSMTFTVTAAKAETH